MENPRAIAYHLTKAAIKAYKKRGVYPKAKGSLAGSNLTISPIEGINNMQNQYTITKQMVRDHLYFNGPISVSSLVHKMLPHDTISMSDYNVVMAYILELEQESKVRYNLDTGCYEALYVVK